jgi:putative membrane protein
MPPSPDRRALLKAALVLGLATTGLAACAGFGSSRLPIADNNFVMQAAAGGMGEVAFGEMAQRQSSSPLVRQYADQMVAEHTQANRELMAIAGRKGVVPPTALDPGRINVSRQLAMVTGPDFDRQYMAQQAQDHELQAALFRQQASAGTDPELRAFAQKWLPSVEAHAEMARSIRQQLDTPPPPPAAATRARRMR